MTKLAIMQPYLFPYLGYFQLIKSVDIFVLYDEVNFIKKGWINRNRLLEVNKEPVYFTIPIKQQSSFKKIKHTKIVDHTWKKSLLNLIHYNYKKSPFYKETIPLIVKLLNCNSQYISILNKSSIAQLTNYLSIDTRIVTDMKFDIFEAQLLHTKHASKYPLKEKRVIELCKLFGASSYTNTINGKALYSKPNFIEHGIELKFIQMASLTYKQNASIFYDKLSIIDVLMNCGQEYTKKLLLQYKLL